MLINTSHGTVIDSRAVICGLKDGTIGNPGFDVYEEEADLTAEALAAIAETTIANITAFEQFGRPVHEVRSDARRAR